MLAVERIAYLMERERAEGFRVKAYRRAATALRAAGSDEVRRRADAGTLTELPSVGKGTATLVAEALTSGDTPPRLLADLEARAVDPVVPGAEPILDHLQGDCHLHSDASDGSAPLEVMARTARDVVLGGRGHRWAVITDHSQRLTVANGLSAQRRRAQLAQVRELNVELAPFRLLAGIEVDILDEGDLDCEPALLAELDVVVASVHSKLRSDATTMTKRMIAAVTNPHVDVLGHCTGRLVTGERGTRPPSQFDARAVFTACRDAGVAVEINARPERRDPPRALLELALEIGCLFSLDTDAHAPGQLDWQAYGAARAVEVGVPADRIVTTWDVDTLLAWAGRHC